MPPPPRVDLFFDAISPYTHISLNLWSRYAKAWPITLKLRPFFLGGVMLFVVGLRRSDHPEEAQDGRIAQQESCLSQAL